MKRNKIFKYGQSIVALTNTPLDTDFRYQKRTRGNVYKVHEIQFCCKCGVQMINIGQVSCSTLNDTLECNCGNEQDALGLYWTESKHFCGMDDLEEEMLFASEKEDYEFAGELKKIIENIEVTA